MTSRQQFVAMPMSQKFPPDKKSRRSKPNIALSKEVISSSAQSSCKQIEQQHSESTARRHNKQPSSNGVFEMSNFVHGYTIEPNAAAPLVIQSQRAQHPLSPQLHPKTNTSLIQREESKRSLQERSCLPSGQFNSIVVRESALTQKQQERRNFSRQFNNEFSQGAATAEGIMEGQVQTPDYQMMQRQKTAPISEFKHNANQLTARASPMQLDSSRNQASFRSGMSSSIQQNFMTGAKLIHNFSNNQQSRHHKQKINSLFQDETNENDELTNGSQLGHARGNGVESVLTKRSFQAIDALGRPISNINFDPDASQMQTTNKMLMCAGVTIPHTPLENPSLFSSYLGGTQCGDARSNNCTALSQAVVAAHKNLQQLQTQAQEPIFERPLDPYLQEGSASNLPTNAKMSIVTSDSNVIREQIRSASLAHYKDNNQYQIVHPEEGAKSMGRMAWLFALKPLFESLKAFHCNSKKRHIEKENFMDALQRVRPTLDLREPAEAGEESETQISFQMAWQQFSDHLPEYLTWDHLFDVLLFNSVAAQFVYDLHGPPEGVEQQDSHQYLDTHEGDFGDYRTTGGVQVDDESANVPEHTRLLQEQEMMNSALGISQAFPVTNTVTVLSDPVQRKNDDEEDQQLQMCWSETSGDDGDADADIADDGDINSSENSQIDGNVRAAEIQDGGIFSRHSSSYQRDSNSDAGKKPRQSITGDFKFSFAANVNAAHGAPVAAAAIMRKSRESISPTLRQASEHSQTDIACVETGDYNYSNLVLAKSGVRDDPSTPKRFSRLFHKQEKSIDKKRNTLALERRYSKLEDDEHELINEQSDSCVESQNEQTESDPQNRQRNTIQRISPTTNQFSLGLHSPQLRQTAAFNSIAIRNDRVSGVGLDDGFEILRTSGKELMCEPYSRPGEIKEETRHVDSSIATATQPAYNNNKSRSHAINFITPDIQSKESSIRSPIENTNDFQANQNLVTTTQIERPQQRDQLEIVRPPTQQPHHQSTRSMTSQISDFCPTKDLNVQAQFKDSYSSLTTHINRAVGDHISVNMLQVRSLNMALNDLIKIPEGLTRNLLILNVSRNRLKSLSGVEVCSRLVFLNASHNQIQTVSTIGVLQRLRELYLGNNWLPTASLKEFAGLKALQALDLGFNKLNADLDKWQQVFKTSQLKQLKTLNVKGNTQLVQRDSGQLKSILQTLFPHLQELNPIDIQALSSFSKAGNPRHEIAFTAPPPKRAGLMTLTEMLPAMAANKRHSQTDAKKQLTAKQNNMSTRLDVSGSSITPANKHRKTQNHQIIKLAQSPTKKDGTQQYRQHHGQAESTKTPSSLKSKTQLSMLRLEHPDTTARLPENENSSQFGARPQTCRQGQSASSQSLLLSNNNNHGESLGQSLQTTPMTAAKTKRAEMVKSTAQLLKNKLSVLSQQRNSQHTMTNKQLQTARNGTRNSTSMLSLNSGKNHQNKQQQSKLTTAASQNKRRNSFQSPNKLNVSSNTLKNKVLLNQSATSSIRRKSLLMRQRNRSNRSQNSCLGDGDGRPATQLLLSTTSFKDFRVSRGLGSRRGSTGRQSDADKDDLDIKQMLSPNESPSLNMNLAALQLARMTKEHELANLKLNSSNEHQMNQMTNDLRESLMVPSCSVNTSPEPRQQPRRQSVKKQLCQTSRGQLRLPGLGTTQPKRSMVMMQKSQSQGNLDTVLSSTTQLLRQQTQNNQRRSQLNQNAHNNAGTLGSFNQSNNALNLKAERSSSKTTEQMVRSIQIDLENDQPILHGKQVKNNGVDERNNIFSGPDKDQDYIDEEDSTVVVERYMA